MRVSRKFQRNDSQAAYSLAVAVQAWLNLKTAVEGPLKTQNTLKEGLERERALTQRVINPISVSGSISYF